MAIEIHDYDPAWREFAQSATEELTEALPGRLTVIEHVGSTAVPGLAAKPVIDIILAVPDSADEARYVPALEAAGYVLRIRRSPSSSSRRRSILRGSRGGAVRW